MKIFAKINAYIYSFENNSKKDKITRPMFDFSIFTEWNQTNQYVPKARLFDL